ncbi:MAG: hypothetical protein NTZ78_03480 [Candidatus Aureabacteria bacterium]|nr:hypothetical protein [Candidatus Auribacterota bacterium]
MKGDAIASALAYTIRKILFQETLFILALRVIVVDEQPERSVFLVLGE